MSVAVAGSTRGTMACIGCSGWNASWASTLAGDDVQHVGDLSLYCRDCKTVYDVQLADMWPDAPRVRMSPDDVGWAYRRVWWHATDVEDWDTECPGEVYVHVGAKETSMWLAKMESRKYLYTVRVVGDMPKRLISDKIDSWGKYSTAYVNAYEFVGRVSLYLPKKRLEVIDKVEL